MAPPKSSKPKPTNQDLKQGVLSFSSKRNASAALAKGQKPIHAPRKAASVTSSLSRSDEERIESSSEGTDGPPATKKLKVKGGDGALVKNGAVNTDGDVPNDKLVALDLQDKSGKLRKHHGEVMKQMGNMKPIHGEGQTKVHDILRVFDLSYKYGPCVGISRLQRWERAQALGMNPPPEVHEILLTKEGVGKEEFSQSVFYQQV